MVQQFKANDGKVYPVSDRIDLNDPNWVKILNNIVEYLDGVDHSTFTCSKNLPFETIDQVHGQMWHPSTCGCVLKTVFSHWCVQDAHKKGQSINVPVHAHRSHKVCGRHKEHFEKHGHHGHHKHVHEENVGLGMIGEWAKHTGKDVAF